MFNKKLTQHVDDLADAVRTLDHRKISWSSLHSVRSELIAIRRDMDLIMEHLGIELVDRPAKRIVYESS